MFKIIIFLIFAFFLGAIPFGYLITYLFSKEDIRKIGSGNIGATNVSRKLGLIGGFITFLLDSFKGYLAVWILMMITFYPSLIGLSGLLAVLGHMFTPFLSFKGGKGISTSFGVFFKIAPIPALISLLIFIIVLIIFRYVSLSSLISSALFPPVSYFLNVNEWFLIYSVCICILIIVKHKENIKRLIEGKELKFGRKI